MDIGRLIEALSVPDAYPFVVDEVIVRQTHISAAFLVGAFVYKVKKPVNMGFLDFSTLEKRRQFCEEEIRLNRRLAPSVYVGVVPVSRLGEGVKMEGAGDVMEWAVKMERLPDEATLERRIEQGQVGPDLVAALARKIATFHSQADAGSRIAEFGRCDVAARNARENFEQSTSQVGVTVSRIVLERLKILTEEALARLGPLLDARAGRGVPRDTHGDLHLDHVYYFPNRAPPADMVIIDCIEFNERFRFADPVADMAFLTMDLAFHGRRDLATNFSESYFQAAADEEGRALLAFFTAYRAAVRGKVEGFELAEREVPQAEKTVARARSRAHWLMALGALEEPQRRPCLIMVGGLPGTGKSTLARELAAQAGFYVVRSDVVRKELAGLPTQARAPFPFGEGIYTPEWTERTYGECLRRAEQLLFEGKRVIVDATFGAEKRRRAFLEAGAQLRVPMVFILCRAGPEEVRLRLERRKDDASDANLSVYQQAAACWEEIGPLTRPSVYEIQTGTTTNEALVQANSALRQLGVMG
jgi:aminoglycoside phosphotransferase family enzyme/predicted kinase